MPWFMRLHKEDKKHHLVSKLWYNYKHEQGKLVVENVFEIMKQTFNEILRKTKLHIMIVPDVFNVSYFLHNLIFGRNNMDIEEFM
jgi:hypothetical protein